VETTHAAQGSVAKTPYSPETISCPALILGDSGWSKQDLGFDGSGKLTTFPNEFPESRVKPLRSEIKAENGRFLEYPSFQVTWARAMLEL
jgi:hypothetical protein